MTYRPVDLQVSIPKVQETGAQQGYYQSRLAAEARAQEQDTARRSEASRRRPAELESTGSLRTGAEGTGSGGKHEAESKRNKKVIQTDGAAAEVAHPFKGQHVDFSL